MALTNAQQSIINKRRYRENPEHYKSRSKAWYSANVERASEYHKLYRKKRAASKKAYAAAYYLRNAEKIKDRVKAYQPAWRAANPEKWLARANRYRAAKLRAVPPWSDAEAIEKIYAECRRTSEETWVEHHVDHIIPLQGKTASGLHVSWNLQILPGKENQSKGNRIPRG